MSQSDAYPVDDRPSNQFHCLDIHAVSHSALASDWVEVSRIAQASTGAGNIHTEHATEECSQSPIAPCDDENPQTGAVIVRAFNDREQCSLVMADLPARTTVCGSLKEEVHLARAKARHTRFVFQQAAEHLDAVERRVREQEDQTIADCGCLRCIGRPTIDDDDARSESSETSLDIPRCVEDCFEYEREAFVSNERLVELEMDYKVSQEVRERNRGVDGGLDAAFEESETVYRRKRQELSEALAIAHYRLFVRRNACIAQGLDPETFRYRHH